MVELRSTRYCFGNGFYKMSEMKPSDSLRAQREKDKERGHVQLTSYSGQFSYLVSNLSVKS